MHRRLAEWNIVESEQVVNIGSGHFGPVNAVVCVSKSTRDVHRRYEDTWREAGPRFEVVYNGIDPHNFEDLPSKNEMRARLELPLDRPIVGRVSALARNKLPIESLEIIPLVLKHCKNALFVIVGDGPQRNDAEKWCERKQTH